LQTGRENVSAAIDGAISRRPGERRLIRIGLMQFSRIWMAGISVVKPANLKEKRLDRRFAANQNGKRKVVVIVRERGGASVPAVFGTESQAASFIRARIAKGTTVHADESGAWDGLHDRYEMKRINHQEAYSFDGACTNQAEEYFSRLRDRHPPPYRWRVPAPLHAGVVMA
jgi:hypothetical protein